MNKREVIVIGGGIAGLTAAAELQNCRVTLLEAKERFGGRIHTSRTDGQIIELGAEFVHGKSKPLLDAIHTAKLSMHSASKDNQRFDGSHLHPVEVWESFGDLTQQIDTRAPDLSFTSFLDEQSMSDVDRQMMVAFVEGFNAAHADRISSHSLRRAEYAAEQMEGDEQMRINCGYSGMADFMTAKARAVGATLMSGLTVRAIHWQEGHVEVEAIRQGNLEAFSADAAIITLPLGVLKSRAVVFEPSLPDKEEAIAGLEFGNVTKVILVFRKQWWPGADFGFIHALEEALPTWWSDPRGPVLTGWAGGSKADALLHCTVEQLRTMAIDILSRVFSVSSEFLENQIVSIHSHNWASDPFARGAYSYIPVGGLFFPKQLGAPVDNTLFFAGEATAYDAQMGTVFAAMESGLRAAHELERCEILAR